MEIALWILLFLSNSLILKWIISWGGAKWISTSWLNVVVFGLLFSELNEQQVRLWALIIWLVLVIWFVIGLFSPQFRLLKASVLFLDLFK